MLVNLFYPILLLLLFSIDSSVLFCLAFCFQGVLYIAENFKDKLVDKGINNNLMSPELGHAVQDPITATLVSMIIVQSTVAAIYLRNSGHVTGAK